LGQIAERGAARFDRFTDARNFVRREVVDDDDVIALVMKIENCCRAGSGAMVMSAVWAVVGASTHATTARASCATASVEIVAIRLAREGLRTTAVVSADNAHRDI
jgi:hypothetical protein